MTSSGDDLHSWNPPQKRVVGSVCDFLIVLVCVVCWLSRWLVSLTNYAICLALPAKKNMQETSYSSVSSLSCLFSCCFRDLGSSRCNRPGSSYGRLAAPAQLLLRNSSRNLGLDLSPDPLARNRQCLQNAPLRWQSGLADLTLPPIRAWSAGKQITRYTMSALFHECGRRVGMVPRSSLKGGKNSLMVEKGTRTQKTTTKGPQAESPPSCRLSSVLGETGETKKSV